jgi:paraquat-inducible protein B
VKAGSLKSIIQGGIAFDTDNLKARSKKDFFKLHNSYAAIEDSRYLNNGGKYFTLHADAPGSIKKNSPIYYKRFQAGKVLDMKFNTQTDRVDINIYIEKQFVNKINSSTHFYNASGLDVSLDFPKLKVNMESIESLVSGALAFVTLDKKAALNTSDEYLLFENHQSAEDEDYKATLHLENSLNLHNGSKIMYKGIVIGEVSDLNLSAEGVDVTMSIQKNYKYLMVKDTLISLSNFELSLEGVKNPEAIIGGASLHVKAGVSKVLEKDFMLKDILSHENQLREGLRIAVSASRRSSLKVGTPILYRQIKIGDIEEYRLSDDSRHIEFSLFIEPCYAHLVRKNSRFYNASALGLEINLSGIKVKTETVETMINGGIVLVTPTKFDEQAENMQVFTLKSEPKEEWLDWHPQLSSTDVMCQ